MRSFSIVCWSLGLCFLLFCVGCAGGSETRDEDLEDAAGPSPMAARALQPLIQVAEEGQVDAQRELAKRLLFGEGVPANPTEAIRWARRAALNGDGLASLWMGRTSLNAPIDRREAGAWFLIAQGADDAAVREDASAELRALDLEDEERSQALIRAEELSAEIRSRLE